LPGNAGELRACAAAFPIPGRRGERRAVNWTDNGGELTG
jgi:hypothetical protein